MRTIAVPFVGRAASADTSSVAEKTRVLLSALLAALDRLVPPAHPGREAEPPPEWYRFPPF